MSLLLTLEEREWISKNAVKEVGGGEGRTFRIADMRLLVKRLREQRFKENLSPIISVMPIREDVKKQHSYTFAVFHDRQFDVRYGIYQRLNKQGEPIFQRMELKETMDLDITKDDDAYFWLVARMHPRVQGSPFEDKPYFKIYDPSKEILGERNKMEELVKAIDRVKKMNIKEKVYFLRYVGVPLLDSYNEDILDGLLFQFINQNPYIFNNKFESSTRSIHEIFHSALSLGIITYSPDKGYSFNGMKLANTDYDTITFISKDRVTFSAILDKIKSLDNILTSIEKKSEKLEKVTTPQGETAGNNNDEEFL